MDLTGISTLIFDYGGVIINLDRNACVRRCRELGIRNADSLLGDYVQSGIFLQLERGEISPAEFRDQLRRLADVPLTDAQIDDAFGCFLLDIPPARLEKLVELRHKYRVLMLSNTNAIHFPLSVATRFPQSGHAVDDCFDKCYLSYQMHLCKPDPLIFRELLRQEGVQAAECLFLDDSATNIEAAASLGFRTCLVEDDAWLHFLH